MALNVMIRHRFATAYRVSSLADTFQSVPSSHISSGTESALPQKHKQKHHKPIHPQSQLILDSISHAPKVIPRLNRRISRCWGARDSHTS